MVSLISCFLGTGISKASDEWGQFNRYKVQNDSIKSLPEDQRPVVVFMGNSITEGWVKEDPEFFKTNNYEGRGISGQSSYQMLSRFREDVINLKPRMVVINGGTNDIAENTHPYNEEITFGNIVSMVELAKANNIAVVLTSLLPADEFYWRPEIKDAPAKIISLNNRIKTYAKENDLPYADYYSEMIGENYALKEEYSEDKVHPTLKGYKVMEEVIVPVIKNNLTTVSE